MWNFYGLNYAFAYACFYDTSMGHYTWYLVPCNELSLLLLLLQGGAALIIDYGQDGPYSDSLMAIRGHTGVQAVSLLLKDNEGFHGP
jgi:hypothetical protein